jgi:predicted ATPase
MIDRVRLINFKCFKDENINFTNLNLLAGLNSMGKSTLIQALLLLKQSYDMGLLQENGTLALNGELVQIGNSKDLLYQYFEGDKNVCIELTLSDSKSFNCGWKVLENIDILEPVEKIEIDKEIFKSVLFGNKFHYLNAERLGPRMYYDVSTYKVRNRNQIGVQGEFAINYLDEHGKQKIPIKELQHQEFDGNTLYEQVNAWLSEIRPGTRITCQSNIDVNLAFARFQFASGREMSDHFTPINVGFGLSYILPLLVVILSSSPGTLLIIENPEAHLHPKGQAQIGKLLALAAANGLQIIVETHSDHVLNGVRVAVKDGLIVPEKVNLLFFTGAVIQDKFEHYTLTPKIDKDGRIDIWPDGFFDEWDKQLIKLI